MNHGSLDKASLLSNLLGASGNHAAGAKKTTSTTQTDSAQRFQDAMQKARPEVAAREPAAAKRPDPVRRAEPARPDVQPPRERAADKLHQRSKDSVTQTQQDARIKSQRADANVVAKRDDHADKPAQSAADVDDASNSDSTCVSANTETKTVAPTASEAEQQNTVQTDEPVIENTEAVIDNPLLNLLAVTPTPTAEDTSTNIVLMATTGVPSDSELLNTEALDAEVILKTAAAIADLVDSSEAATLAANVTQAVATSVGSKDTPALAAGLNLHAGLTADSEALDLSLPESLVVEATGEADGDTTESLSGTKVAFSKLLESSLLNAGGSNTGSSGDKTAPTADAAKLVPTPASGNPALDVLSRLSEAQTSPAARAFVVQTGVNVPVGQPQWSQAVGDKVLWLAAQNVSAAEIRLDPPDLGPMSVKVSVNQDQATVSFTSPHPIVREALDQQLNRLREMFAEQGLNLVNVDVSDKSFAQQEREKNESGKGAGGLVDDEDELQPVAVTSALNMRLVDHYA